ncbi:hypothetical protein [Pseudaminobacter salicylatoxidans]|uniref:hypothetical protein n=1 Tax=Pseudaminobacter salicylatoxidans TaxID=93369 RepID=UPI0012F67150|nr:hypothetical protein [Pseudaminobacter salicylatoxidans]
MTVFIGDLLVTPQGNAKQGIGFRAGATPQANSAIAEIAFRRVNPIFADGWLKKAGNGIRAPFCAIWRHALGARGET